MVTTSGALRRPLPYSLAARHTRQLVIIGVRHVGSLKGIFREDPAYRLIEAAPYLGRG